MRRLTLALGFALSLTIPAQALVPVPWIPSNAGVLWYTPGSPLPIIPQQPPGEGNGSLWLTRRVVSSPTLPGVMHLGSFFNGLYTSAGGGGWATLTPGCWLPVNAPLGVQQPTWDFARHSVIALTGLDACGIEGIAYDSLIPTRMFASAYDVVKLVGNEPTLGDGGVYVSDTLGVSWRKLTGGLRGNGLAIARPSGSLLNTIVTGYIQSSNAAVGTTPGNGSLSISRDEGTTWENVVLPASGCADIIETSQRLTPTIAFNPVDANKIYAGTNAGLYVSSDAGHTWTLAKQACGGVWGIALMPDGNTIWIGDKDGVISSAPTSTMSFTASVDLGVGKVQSLIIDPTDPRLMYAAVWSGADANVYRLWTIGGTVKKLDDSTLRDVVPVEQSWPAGVPKPFPLSFKNSAGQAAPSLFLSVSPFVGGPLWVSTILRGAFVRSQ